MSSTPEPATSRPTGARARTRQAILDAAFQVLGDDQTASLGAVADAAGVARTTLHRAFPDRQALLDALTVEARRRLGEVHARAHLDSGTAHEATIRLAAEYCASQDVFRLVIAGVVPESVIYQDGTADAELRTLLKRGHADGTLDPDLDHDWFTGALWGNLYLVSELLNDGKHAPHDVTTRYLRAVDKAVRP